MIFVLGEISTNAELDYPSIIRSTIKGIGYDHSDKGFDYKTCSVIMAVEEQSPEIAVGVHLNRTPEDMGAGDQVSRSPGYGGLIVGDYVWVCHGRDA